MAHSSAGQHMAAQNLDLVSIHTKKKKKEKKRNTLGSLLHPPSLSSTSSSSPLLSIHLSFPIDAGKVKTEGERKKISETSDETHDGVAELIQSMYVCLLYICLCVLVRVFNVCIRI